MKDQTTRLEYARRWARRSGSPVAWSNLAAIYATKQPPDLKRARYWYRRAALKGDDRGIFEYAVMLIQGEGGPKRPAQGHRYLERAAALGQIDALKLLTHALSHGEFGYRISRPRAKAIKLKLRQALSARVQEE